MLTFGGAYEQTFKRHRERLADAYIMDKARHEADAWAMTSSQWQPANGEILPQALGDEAVKAQMRITRQVINAAPRVLKTRRAGAVGNVTASTGNKADDQEIAALNVRALARRGVEQALVTGVTAFRAHTLPSEQGGLTVISRVSGFLHPITDPDDVDRYVMLMQVWEGESGKGYNVRLWDLDKPEYEEFLGIKNPTDAMPGTGQLVDVETPPRLCVVAADGDGYPVGEIATGLQLLKADYAAQFRIIRVAELFGFPVPVAKGAVSMPKVWQPGATVTTGPDGSFAFVIPSGVEQLFTHQDRINNAMREHFNLPSGVMGSGGFTGAPSGEALAEANLRFQQASSDLADATGQVLNQAGTDWATIKRSKTPLNISVTPSYERNKDATIASVIALRDKRLIPPSVAVRAIQPLVSGFQAEEAEAWIKQLDMTTDPAALLAMLTGSGGDSQSTDGLAADASA